MDILSAVKKFMYRKEKLSGIKIENLSVSYGRKNIIKNLSFDVKPRQIHAIVGLSGSGKSTILKSIVGLQSHKGKVKMDGDFGYCPQENAFFEELTIAENIILFGSLHGLSEKESMYVGRKYLNNLNMEDKINSFSYELSGGQQKRLNIILSILHNPKKLVLDEPFAGLDFYNRKILWDFFLDLKSKGITVLLTTHLLNEAEDYANKILVIKDGKKFAYGSINSILKSKHLEIIFDLRTNYINSGKMSDIKHFCMKNKIHILDADKTHLTFGLDEGSRDSLEKFLSRKKIKLKTSHVRKPVLDDLFLVAVTV